MFTTIALLPLILSLSVHPAHVSSPCTVVNGVIIAEGGSGCSYGPVNPPHASQSTNAPRSPAHAPSQRASVQESRAGCAGLGDDPNDTAGADSGAFQDALANDPDFLNKIKAALGQVGDLASQAAQPSAQAAAAQTALDAFRTRFFIANQPSNIDIYILDCRWRCSSR
ncbi:hypothetical protein R3P38DRAFT_3368036 [Favolaschia claudopus]|uniref:Uncharacterized protein n=1 Tax=Favolaschia claudopus TaxID=2862362 RepID=A0AAW0A7N1_9AGAR